MQKTVTMYSIRGPTLSKVKAAPLHAKEALVRKKV
jgi:hypothetical protein